eukprot:8047-Heterococcus_DN1.PRE.1
MSGPTQLLPYFSAADEACLADAGTARIRAVGSAAEFYSLFLASNSEFDTAVHNGLGDKFVKEDPWVNDGKLQCMYEIACFPDDFTRFNSCLCVKHTCSMLAVCGALASRALCEALH